MGKISLLDPVVVDGTETVVVVKAGATRRASLIDLVAAAGAPINIVGEPGELVVNAAGYVQRRTIIDGSIDTGSPARDLAIRQARGSAHVARMKARYAAAPLAPLLSRYQHWQLYGQSLSCGAGSIPFYVDPVGYAKMANGGVRYLDSNADLAVSFASIEPMVSKIAETGMFAAIRMYAQALLEEDGVDITATGQAILGTCIGEGSRGVAELSAAPYFPRVRADYDKAIALGTAAAITVTPTIAFWLQGERDEQLDTSVATYRAALEALRVLMQTEARGATGDAALILPMLTYQTATHLYYARVTPDVALAQLAEARANPYIAMATPSYFIPFQSETEVHCFSLGYVWLLAYFGLAAKRWLVDGIKPMPLASLSTTRSGKCIRIVYDVEPDRSLQLDTATIANQGNYGFSITNSGGAAKNIVAVRIIAPNVVEIECDIAIGANWKWRYGWTTVNGVAGRGNLRDNSPIVFDPDNAALPMWKWAAIDEGTAA